MISEVVMKPTVVRIVLCVFIENYLKSNYSFNRTQTGLSSLCMIESL